jgi:hypothetical protein
MLLSSNSIEAQTNIIKIEDIDSATIGAFVRWMHFLKLNNFDSIAISLFKAAHKYDITQLMVSLKLKIL